MLELSVFPLNKGDLLKKKRFFTQIHTVIIITYIKYIKRKGDFYAFFN